MLIRDLFGEELARTPDTPAVVFRDREISRREFNTLSNRLAQGVSRLGVEKGDRVASVLSNCVEFAVTYLGLLKNGAVFVPLNPQLTPSHLEYIVNHAECKVLMCDRDSIPAVLEAWPRLTGLTHVVSVGGETAPAGMLPFEEILAMGQDIEPSVHINEEDIAAFLYTAGTTGAPKGVVHSHFNCSYVAKHWARVFHMGPGRSVLVVLPLFHAFGLHCITLPALISGARLIIAERYHTQSALEAVQKHRVSVLPLVPAMGNLIIHHEDFPKYDLSSLEVVLMGGAIVPFELLRQWREAFPELEIINGYGQTESCPCATGLWDRDILEKPRSVGKAWDEVDLKILDDQGQELPPNGLGEIVYRVPSVMKGYYKDPDLTSQTVRDGWLYSGDLGYMDPEGYVYIVDRKKDIIIRGGENISSMEIEEVLHQHPAVLEASVIGAPDRVLGETVMAVVVRKPGRDLSAEEVIRFCGEHLEPFKVPVRVEFVDALPRNPAGKTLKRELKSKYLGQAEKASHEDG